MLRMSEIWSARNHSEDFTMTRIEFMTVRFRWLVCLLMVGLPAWSVVDWLTLSTGQYAFLLKVRMTTFLALSPLIPFSFFINYRLSRMRAALGYLMSVMLAFALICMAGLGHVEGLQMGYTVFPYLMISLFAVFPIPLMIGFGVALFIFCVLLLGRSILLDQALFGMETLNQLWLLLLFTLTAAWVQAGQLNMLLRLYRESTTDELTGMMNRRLLMKQLEQARAALMSRDRPFALLLLDLDRFKRINDNYGHLAGDAVLHTVATTLGEQLEKQHVLGRYGGEEFAILLPRCATLEQARQIAERLRLSVEARAVKSPASDEMIEVTVSIGVALAKRGEGVQALLNRADECLYQAKINGRNCVVVTPPSSQSMAV
ncbi:GGDEF domain-containing protein [Aeromonas schubertii]|uniref:GGDEF domain-containing protein n=1 Tax=Aeromonas schubertii TaxID=652 RepID=UPI00295F0E2C|nr:GGDEF domain-containing protein [Aeromonas schubertii]